MEEIVWTIGGSKTELASLLEEIRSFEAKHGGKLVPDDCQPQKLPPDPDAPMGQIEWYEVVIAIVTSAAGSALYEGTKAIIKKHVAARTNRATFKESRQDK